MIFNVTSGAGGGGLNIRVVGGTTQPTSPREGTIWVKTSAEKPDYILSATQPGSPASGLVWIKLGSDGVSLPVDKKGTLAITLAGCALYSGGSWANADAWVCTGGQWVQFSHYVLFLYKQGNQYPDSTGGIIGWNWVLDWSSKGTIDFLSDRIKLAASGSSIAATPTKKIDLSQYGKLIVRKTNGWFDAEDRAFLAVTATNTLQMRQDLTAYIQISKVDAGEYVLDISELSGEYYVGVFLFAVQGVAYTIEFGELRLE